jgi:phosphohistidine phosphatase
MKTLMLLRHAKSSWKDSTVADHDRPLNRRGMRAADLVRGFLQRKKLRPKFVLSSSAARTRQTVEIVFESLSPAPEVRYDAALYLASAAKLLDVISRLADDQDQVVLVGHNPGMEDLLFRLTHVDQHFPTATLASIALAVEKWSEVEDNKGELRWLVTPKQLETL